MSCNIHSYAEVRSSDGAWQFTGDVFPATASEEHFFGKKFGPHPITEQHYGLYGFLADVRNYSEAPPISPPRGLPDDLSQPVRAFLYGDEHSHSWLTLAELLAVDYDQVFWDRRVNRVIAPGFISGRERADEGEGRRLTLREFLPREYFAALKWLKQLGKPEDVRIVFWFDN